MNRKRDEGLTMAYQQFAYLYDDLMKDSPYNEWEALFKRRMRRYGDTEMKRILDIGCGTGELTVRLGLADYHVTGVDLSADMLTVAYDKASSHGLEVSLYQQDMRELNVPGRYDAAIIFCDSLNYLEKIEEVTQTFQRVYDQLEMGGLIIFDVHSQYKINTLFKNHDFIYNEDELAYIWECFEGPNQNSVYHDLTFFVRQPSGLYQRIEESHIQTTWTTKQLFESLQECGFEVVQTSADFTDEAINEKSERLFFTAIKK